MTETGRQRMLRDMDCQGRGRRSHLRGKFCNAIGFSPVTGPLRLSFAQWNDSDRRARVADQEVPDEDGTINFCRG
jgi:hypothetical protein